LTGIISHSFSTVSNFRTKSDSLKKILYDLRTKRDSLKKILYDLIGIFLSTPFYLIRF
jgi:hypothetical protein